MPSPTIDIRGIRSLTRPRVAASQIILWHDLESDELHLLVNDGFGGTLDLTASMGGSAHVIENSAGASLTARGHLQFNTGLTVTDDSANDRTIVDASGSGVTNGDSHDHLGGDGAQILHSSLGSIGADDHHAKQHSVTSALDHTFPGGTTSFLRADGAFATPPTANTASAVLDFGNELDGASTTVAAAWVTGSTKLSALILGEDALVQQISVTVDNISPGVGFDVLGFAPEGASGTFTVHLVGA